MFRRRSTLPGPLPLGRVSRPGHAGFVKGGKKLCGFLLLLTLIVVFGLQLATPPKTGSGEKTLFAKQEEETHPVAEQTDSETETTSEASSEASLFDLGNSSKPRISLQRTVLALVGVLALIIVGVPLMKKFLSPGLTKRGQGRIKISETLPLGGRRYLCLVDVPGKTLVLGVTEDTIRNLSEIPSTSISADPENGATFETRLSQTLECHSTCAEPEGGTRP